MCTVNGFIRVTIIVLFGFPTSCPYENDEYATDKKQNKYLILRLTLTYRNVLVVVVAVFAVYGVRHVRIQQQHVPQVFMVSRRIRTL